MIWVLEDPRAGTAAQALGIAERLERPFRRVALHFGRWAGLPWPWPSLAGLADHSAFQPPWPSLVISAGRRAAPVSRWLRARGARTVHAMRPGLGAADFDLLVIGRHDRPGVASNIMLIQGAAHRLTPAALAGAAAGFAELARLPRPITGLLLGGPVRSLGMPPEQAAAIGATVAGLGGSVIATTSRRTGDAAASALADALAAMPHHLHRWGAAGPNPFTAILALADRLVVTADSISMLSEALMTTSPLFIAGLDGVGPRHRALAGGLVAAGLAAPLGAPAPPPRAALDETGRVAAEILRRGWA
jgi:mitochondrial fission protein ELM1